MARYVELWDQGKMYGTCELVDFQSDHEGAVAVLVNPDGFLMQASLGSCKVLPESYVPATPLQPAPQPSDLHDAIMQMQMRFGQHVGIGEAPFRDGFEQCRHAAAELVAASEAGNPASVQPIGHVVVWNKGSSREVKRIEPIGKPGVSLARDLPQGALLYIRILAPR